MVVCKLTLELFVGLSFFGFKLDRLKIRVFDFKSFIIIKESRFRIKDSWDQG